MWYAARSCDSRVYIIGITLLIWEEEKNKGKEKERKTHIRVCWYTKLYMLGWDLLSMGWDGALRWLDSFILWTWLVYRGRAFRHAQGGDSITRYCVSFWEILCTTFWRQLM